MLSFSVFGDLVDVVIYDVTENKYEQEDKECVDHLYWNVLNFRWLCISDRLYSSGFMF
jgi:hypothetical protein